MTQLSLEHRYRPSTLNDGTAPLVVMLHGYGSDMNDLFSFASELPEEYAVVSLQAPYAMQPYGNAWYAIHWDQAEGGKFNDIPQAIASRKIVDGVIDEAIAAYPVDKDRVAMASSMTPSTIFLEAMA